MGNIFNQDFLSTMKKSLEYETNGLKIRLIHYNSLIKAKKSSGRLKDLNDKQHLEQE